MPRLKREPVGDVVVAQAAGAVFYIGSKMEKPCRHICGEDGA